MKEPHTYISFLEHYLGNRIAGSTLPAVREKLAGEGKVSPPGSQGCRYNLDALSLFHRTMHTGRAQGCPCIARTKVCRALCCSPPYKRRLDLNVRALANNNNGKQKDEFGE